MSWPIMSNPILPRLLCDSHRTKLCLSKVFLSVWTNRRRRKIRQVGIPLTSRTPERTQNYDFFLLRFANKNKPIADRICVTGDITGTLWKISKQETVWFDRGKPPQRNSNRERHLKTTMITSGWPSQTPDRRKSPSPSKAIAVVWTFLKQGFFMENFVFNKRN